jgi:hypothetical protein
MSTMDDTSFLTFSGRVDGSSPPVNLILQRYIARANSGKSSCPDFVVSDKIHIWDRALPGSFDRSNKSLALSPDRDCDSPAADLNNCSNFAWSVAVMKESLTFGILARPLAAGLAGAGAEDDEVKDWAICEEVC